VPPSCFAPLRLGLNFELVIDASDPGHLLGFGLDGRLLFGAFHRPAQRDHPIRGDDLDVVGVGRQRFVANHGPADAGRDLPVGRVFGLVARGRVSASAFSLGRLKFRS
jgi:hypothetical protein